MSLAIIKQLMHLMPTNELLILIPETCISKHVCSCYAADSPQDYQISIAPRCPKTYILNSTRILALGLLQGSNGVLQDLRQALLVKVLLLLLHKVIGIGDLLQLITPSRNQISTTSEMRSDLLHHPLGNQVPARNNYDSTRSPTVIPRFDDHRLRTIQIILLRFRIRHLKDYRNHLLFNPSKQRPLASPIPTIQLQTLASLPHRTAVTVGQVRCRHAVGETVLHQKLGPLPTTEYLRRLLATPTSNTSIIRTSHMAEV